MRIGLVLLAGCAPAPEGDADDSGAPSPDSAEGVVWVDAAGEVVDGVVSLPEGLSFVDGDGFVWRLDPYFGLSAAGLEVHHSDEDCQIEVGLYPPPPRYVVELDDGRMLAVPDDAEYATPDSVFVVLGNGDCVEDGSNDLVTTPMANMVEVGVPSLDWTPPVHPELR